jgi:thioesterase domain-containing protein
MTQIEAAIGVLYPIETLVGSPTPRKLAERIASDIAGGAATHVLLPVQTDGRRTPLFMIHGLHGQIYIAGYLRGRVEDRPIWGIRAAAQDPDRDRPRSVKTLAEDYIAAIRSVRPSGPYVLAGYCAGTFIAWEMARRLRAIGESVPLVLAIDPPPFFGNFIGGRLPADIADDRQDRAFRERTLANLIDSAGTHPDFSWIRSDAKALDRAVRTAVALRHAFLDYLPRPYDGPVTFLCSRNKGGLIAAKKSAWRPLVGNRIDIETLSEFHLDLFRPDNAALGETIDRVLKARNV